MQTNIVNFRKNYLVKFLKYQVKHHTNIWHYYKDWLSLHLEETPSYYNYKKKKLSKNQFRLELSFWEFEKNNFLCLKDQKKFENIVEKSFNAIFYTRMFSSTETINSELEKFISDYSLEYSEIRTLKEKYLRIRKNGTKTKYKSNDSCQDSICES